ncbi:unnamed protein product [Calypogeia fissa]
MEVAGAPSQALLAVDISQCEEDLQKHLRKKREVEELGGAYDDDKIAKRPEKKGRAGRAWEQDEEDKETVARERERGEDLQLEEEFEAQLQVKDEATKKELTEPKPQLKLHELAEDTDKVEVFHMSEANYDAATGRVMQDKPFAVASERYKDAGGEV